MKIAKIALIRRVERKETDDSAIKIFIDQTLEQLLDHQAEAKIFIGDDFDRKIEEREKLIAFNPDLICVLGGDGTFIRAVREAIGLEAPFLGVNFGHRGFLLPFEPVDFKTYLRDLLTGKEPRFETRHALRATLKTKDGEKSFVCINDCVVKGRVRVIDVEVLVDGKGYLSCSGDGVLVATPSGSTAYNLAAGGSVMAPAENQLAITPICCYGSIERTIGNDRKIAIRVKKASDAVFIPDGMQAIPMTTEDIVNVTTYSTPFATIVPDNHEWYSHIQEKLGAVRV